MGTDKVTELQKRAADYESLAQTATDGAVATDYQIAAKRAHAQAEYWARRERSL